MMGLGQISNESTGLNSSNFSNLSASAPPFNRLNPNPNSNPNSQYSESTYTFEPFGRTWQYASPSAPTSEQVMDSTGMTNMPFSNDYQYSASLSISPSSSQLYSSYVPNMDPLVEYDVPHYDVGPASQIDYVQSLQDLEYGPKWADNLRINEGKRAKRVELDPTFSSETMNIGGSYSYNNQPYLGSGIGYGRTSKEDTGVSYDKFNHFSDKEVQTRSADKGRLEEKSFLEQDLSFLSYKSNKTQIPSPNYLESRPYDVSCEVNSIFSNYQNSPCSTYKKCVISSPAVVIRPPPTVSNSWDLNESYSSRTVDQKSSDHEIKSRFGPQLANTNGFNSVELVNSAVESSDFIEDSPCWKGASSSRFSSCDIEAGTSIHVKKRMDEYYNFVSSDGEGNKNEENKSARNGTLLSLDTTLDSICPRKEKGTSEVPKSNNLKCFFGEDESCPIYNDISGGSSVAVHAAEKVLSSSSSQADLTEGAKLQPESRLDAPTMIKAIHNLSELLLFDLSNASCVIGEEDIETLKHTRDNLDLYMSKKVVQTTNDSEPNNFFGDTSKKFGEFHHVSKILGRPHMTNEESKSPFQEEKKNCSISEKKDEKSPVFSTVGDDLDITRDDDMAKAIKKVLDENFNFDEEMHSQTLLFKNLWLDAEAKLCSIGYKARFNRMQMEMEKPEPRSPKENDDVSQMMAPKPHDGIIPEPSIPNTSPGDTAEASIMARFNILKSREDNVILMNAKEEQKQPEVVDGDSVCSVMSRFNILKSREDNLKSINEQVEQLETRFTDELEDEILGKYSSPRDGFRYEPIKEVHFSVPDDTIAHSYDNVKIINQYYAGGGCESSSSGWEHVLKDDIVWNKL